MLFTVGYIDVAASVAANSRKGKKRHRNNNSRARFDFCPCCGRKGLYKMLYSYEHCRYCGLHRVLLPGQDF